MKILLRSAREFVRHASFCLGLTPKGRINQTGTLAERFEGIYARGDWAVGSDVPLSGTGSTLDATAALRNWLPGMLATLEARTLLDIGCGDFTWMRTVELPCRYVGLDLVASVIAANEAAFADDRHAFQIGNAVADPLPAADVALCREVLFHLSFADAKALLRNVVGSGVQWLMLTTDAATRFNADIESGGARFLNLEIAPFNLGAPDHFVDEPASWRGRKVGVWSAARVKAALGA